MNNLSEWNYQELKKYFGYDTTKKQDLLLQCLSEFVEKEGNRNLFLLRGYAGTGKTTIISSFVKLLQSKKIPFKLMAPTGRAAKVLSKYSDCKALTIHRSIYYTQVSPSGGLSVSVQQNKFKKAVFIIDEASMIGDSSSSDLASSRSLLYDIFTYVYNNNDCKLIFVGDMAQLPPVGVDISPALDIQYLKNTFSLDIEDFELDEVVRQQKKSGILYNATILREKINNELFRPPFFDLYGYKDIVNITGTELLDELTSSFDYNGAEKTVVITRSNKRANLFNQEIRNRILYREEKINAGDYIMVVKNNYFWLDKGSKTDFIANGDILEILSVQKTEQIYGFDFANIIARMIDFPDEKNIEIKVILNSINIDAPALSFEDNNKLYNAIMEDYADIPQKSLRYEKVKQNPYFNALQIKFAYALTCHKTQGGQWNTVFIDQGYVTDEGMNKEYLRWMYTAITRATDKVYLVNFPEKLFEIN